MGAATIELIVVALGIALCIVVLWLIGVTVGMRKLRRQHGIVAKAAGDGEFVAAVSRSLGEIDLIAGEVGVLKREIEALQSGMATAVRNVGMVRFDAFDDVGGKLSFAVALLDDKGDGVVISTINGRQESRSYAKLVTNKDSTFNLSSEERQAIAEALAPDAVKV